MYMYVYIYIVHCRSTEFTVLKDLIAHLSKQPGPVPDAATATSANADGQAAQPQMPVPAKAQASAVSALLSTPLVKNIVGDGTPPSVGPTGA